MDPTIFQNNDIQISDLPSAESAIYNKLDKKYLSVILLGRLIAIALILLVFFFVYTYASIIVLPFPVMFIYAGILVFGSLITLIGYLGFNKKAYALRERDIIYRTGLIIRNQVAIPFNRIQHCEVQQGVIERGFHLAKLKLYTAGGSSSDLSIPGLPVQTANKLRDFVLGKIVSQHEEEE